MSAASKPQARTPGKLRGHPWAGEVEIVQGDVTDAASVRAAMEGVHTAYYLVHALGGGPGFEETDRRAARVFGEQARAAGVARIVYLGGLTPAGVPEEELSPHLRSRAEVGGILLASGVPTAVLRAAVIIGSGSASFEMLRYLTERLPVMVTPRWVRTRIQPIAVRDVLRILVGCANLPPQVNRTFDIGGPDVLTYQEMMQRYAAVAGLRRRVRLAPVLRVAMARFEQQSHVRQRLDELEQKLGDRKDIDRAKALLMERRGMGEAEAYAALRQQAMRQGLKLAEVARRILSMAELLGPGA